MVVDTIKENLCINKLIATKKEIIIVEGDMIIPDSKPDILNTICTSGAICIYKKEVLDEKIRIDGSINTYIMYMSEDSEDRTRGLNTSLDFSENINVPNCQTGMDCKLEVKLKSIECKVINGRKIGIKATMEVEVKIYSNENIDIVSDIQNDTGIQMLKEDLKVNSLVGMGETKIYAKDNIAIDNIDNLAEILKADICICDKDIKVSYNKILTKAEANIKLIYLTEDNRINTTQAKIPIVGFIDIQNVNEDNICDVQYEVKNIVLKPNAAEEHSIYIEIEIGVRAIVYEEKQINLIQDLYSPSEILEFSKKVVNTMSDKRNSKDVKQIREKVNIEGLENRNIIDVDVIPNIEKENKLASKIMYEGQLELRFVLMDNNSQLEIKVLKLPFEHVLDNIENAEDMNTNMTIEITNKDFIIQDGGNVSSNIDMLFDTQLYKNTKLNVIDEIQTNGERDINDYSIIMYIVKSGDSLWKIAKEFGSTVEDIVKINEIEDANRIKPGQKIFIPRYICNNTRSIETSNSSVSANANSNKASLVNYA